MGPGVREICIREETGAFRVLYLASMGDAAYVLHAFQKKAQRTAKRDLELAASRLTQPRPNDLLQGRITKFSLDTLINLAATAGLAVQLEISERA